VITRLIGLIWKEILTLLEDKRSRVVVIVPPIVQLFLFGYGATFDLDRVACAIYDEENSCVSREFLAAFVGSPVFRVVKEIHSEKEMVEVVDRKEAYLVLHVGRRFSRELFFFRPARVQVILDGRNSNSAAILQGYVNQIVSGFNTRWIREHGLPPLPAVVHARARFNPNLESRWFIVPGLVATLTLVISLVTTGLSVAREREAGTMDQLLVSPLRPIEIVLGKLVPGFLIAMGEAFMIFLVAIFWFHVRFCGSLTALFLGLSCFILAILGIGLTISSLAATQQQALLGIFFFLSPAVVLSGFSTPIRNMPDPIQWLTLINPLRYALVVVRRVFLEGAGVLDVWPLYVPMMLIGLVSLSGAWWVFRQRLG
jgi:ABC-2 type transport system permease protein